MLNAMKTILSQLCSRFLLGLVMAGACSGWAETAAEPAPAASSTSPSGNDNKALQLLAEDVPRADIRWLDSSASNKVFSLYRQPSHGEAKGGVLILPTINRHPASPHVIDTLRITLSENHWHTLAIQLPDHAKDLKELAQQYIQSGIEYLNSQGVFNIVLLGEGTGATHAMEYVHNLPTDNPNNFQQVRGLAMINPRNTIAGTDLVLSDNLKGLKVPVLDIFLDIDYRDQREAKQRQQASRQLPAWQYVQIQLPRVGPNWQQQDNRLTKRVRGWLNKTAAGLTVTGRGSTADQ
jgi:hypothetical protein